jgi:hypothetical protein
MNDDLEKVWKGPVMALLRCDGAIMNMTLMTVVQLGNGDAPGKTAPVLPPDYSCVVLLILFASSNHHCCPSR